jgi:ABC-type transport system substrate-binding protein
VQVRRAALYAVDRASIVDNIYAGKGRVAYFWLPPSDPAFPGRTTYQLRRLRLHGLIERQPHSNRYRVTTAGIRTALFCTRTYNRLLRPGYQSLAPTLPQDAHDLIHHFHKLEALLDLRVATAKLIA